MITERWDQGWQFDNDNFQGELWDMDTIQDQNMTTLSLDQAVKPSDVVMVGIRHEIKGKQYLKMLKVDNVKGNIITCKNGMFFDVTSPSDVEFTAMIGRDNHFLKWHNITDAVQWNKAKDDYIEISFIGYCYQYDLGGSMSYMVPESLTQDKDNQ